MSANSVQRMIERRPLAAAAAFLLLLIGFLVVAVTAAADILDRRNDLNAASEMLARLRGRSPASRPADHEIVPSGSPVLEGATVTVAGAALLRRVSEAVTRVDGNVLSSQVDLQGAQAKSGLIAVIISCEVEQPALQRLLYDLEAGMPFLFIDQFSAQAPVATTAGTEGRMRIVLAVSGQWKGAR
jgi:general secretion pathway protein M